MKILFDTSILVAAIVESHPAHDRALPWLKMARGGEVEFIVAAHTLAELYAVLSALPTKPRIAPNTAWRLINENIESAAKIIPLTAIEYGATVKKVADMGLAGGIIYDALIAKAALKAKVDKLLTLNRSHFVKVWDGESDALREP